MAQRLAAFVACILLAAPTARADEFITQANAAYRTIQPGKRSDLVLLPLVAKMDTPPAAAASFERAMLIPHGSSMWAPLETWANAPAQRAILDGLKKVTAETNPVQAYAFGQPYGADALASSADGIALVTAGLYTELGDPPLLAAAKHLYIPALDRVSSLVHVEATRLAGAGKAAEAIDVLIDWAYFARQMADRQAFEESLWGLRTMHIALERIRDVAYVDFRYGVPTLTADQISKILDRLRADGYSSIDRMVFPKGPQIAANQAIAVTFRERSGPNLETFAPTMSRLATSQRPLRLFAEAARWNEIAAVHGNWFDTTDQAQKIFGDWASRWPLDPFDARLSLLSDYEKTSPRRFASLLTVFPDMSVLFNERQIVRTHLVGTRCALGVIAFNYRSKDFPPRLESIRPTFVKVIEADPFNPDRARGKQPPLEYFVPIRDTFTAEREEPKPHQMNVLPRGGDLNFQVSINKDQFILYSVGPDGAKAWAKDVAGSPDKNAVGDLLIWPPITSLLRQRQQETGQIK